MRADEESGPDPGPNRPGRRRARREGEDAAGAADGEAGEAAAEADLAAAADLGRTAAEVLGGVIAALGVPLDLEGRGAFPPLATEAEAVRRLLVSASPARMGVVAAQIAEDARQAAPARISAAKLALECWEQVARAILTGGLAPPAPAPAPVTGPMSGAAHTEESAEGLD